MEQPSIGNAPGGRLRVVGGTVVDRDAVRHTTASSDDSPIGDVEITDGVIVDSVTDGGEPATEQVPQLDAAGCHVLAGFVDVQVNGAFGVDLTTEPHRMAEIARRLPEFGVTAWCPTVISGPPGAVPAALDAVRQAAAAVEPGARILGLHAEGPFLSRERPGTHPVAHLRDPSSPEVADWLRVATAGDGPSTLAMVTLAPELDGALDAIDAFRSAGVSVCIGHTDASAATIAAAADRGAGGATHLFNAMSPLHHRDPGAVGGILARDDLIAGLVVDGVHVDPVAIDVAWRVLGPTRTALVTDAIAALGEPSGRFELGDLVVTVDEVRVTNPDGALAGSVLSMDAAVRNLMAATGCSLADAGAAASATPARLVGPAAAHVGRLRPGLSGDLVVLDAQHRVVATVVGGVVVHDPQQRYTP